MGKIIFVVIATLNPQEKESAQSYMEQVGKMQEEVGANIVDRLPVTEVFLGEPGQMIAIVEFPNKEAFDKVFKSEAYEALIPLRDKGFSKLNAYISGK